MIYRILLKFSLLVSLLTVLCLSAYSSAFTKTHTYADGTFGDVKNTSWYAKEVASAYELGFMNGKAEGQFAPDGNVTVAEAITMASRVHAIYNGKEIEKTEGKWYDMYVQYALSNGIISEGQYDNFDRNIMRYEMAVMFADSMPESYFAAKNNVKEITDVNKNEEYHDKLMMLYNAGVVMGSTEYGDFLATNSIKRRETAAIINRVALPENRLVKTLKEYGDREQAVYLIDNHTMTRTVRSRNLIASGFRYENTIDVSADDKDFSSNVLRDMSNIGHAAMHRDIVTQDDGIVCLEMKYMADNPGYSIKLCDINGKNMFTLVSNSDLTYSAVGDVEQVVNLTYVRQARNMFFEIDIDNRKVKIVCDGNDVGTYDMSGSASGISRVSFETSDKDLLSFTLSEVYMFTNYIVNDCFRTTPFGSAPYGWNIKGKITVEPQQSDLDIYSAKAVNNAVATKTFEAVTGKFVYETFVKVLGNQELVLSLKDGDNYLISVNAGNRRFTCGTQNVREYTDGIWQLVRIEGDTERKTALIKINYKECLTVPFDAESFDSIEIKSTNNGIAYFDDVELYNVYDYADYCPEPVPVTDDEWYVGMSVCSLWREGTHYGWDCITPYDEATPVLGYYDEGLAEVADWEIKMLVEHGYDFQHFCWYIGNASDGIKEPRLGDALHDGFMNARYSHMQDFMIMWENANGGRVKDFVSFKEYVWNYWCDWYFSDDRYFVIDNKPVITIYQYLKFIEQLGGENEAREAIKFMRSDIKKLGYDDMIVLFCNNGSDKTANQTMKNLGGDAYICYNFGEDSYNAEFQKLSMNAAYKHNALSLMPSISVGFNDIGWTETRTPNATPKTYKEVLKWAKDDYMPRIAKRENEAWKSHFVIGNTWNEYGEGHYIMPTNLNKFGYIDANRQVFSAVAGSDDSGHFDIEPTINQKIRLGYLYPNRTQLIKRTYWLKDDTVDYEKLDVIKSWNFEDKNDCAMWLSMANTTPPVFSDNEKALVGRSLSNDPSIKLLKTESNYLDADSIDFMKIRIKYEQDVVSNVTLYFKTVQDKEFAQVRGVSKSIGNTNEYADYYLDLSANSFWKGTVTEIRLDPMAVEGTYFIKEIQFLGSKNNDDFVFSIDGREIGVNKHFVKQENGETFVAGNPTHGFYSLHNFYTEWNRYDGKLLLKTSTGHVFNFTLGSDTASVDGVSRKMAAAFDVIDGLPYLPMKFVYDNADIDYISVTDGFKVTVRGTSVTDEIDKRVEYEYEFNVPGDNEGWHISSANGMVINGGYMMTAIPISPTTCDAKIENNGVSINTNLYKSAEVRVKCSFEDDSSVSTPFTMYFATDTSKGLDEIKTGKILLKDVVPDKDGYYILRFDFSSHEQWKGTVITLRFDPTNSMGTYIVDYIRVIKDPDAEKRMKDKFDADRRRQGLMMQADEGKPFYIENGDAEDVDVEPLSHSSYTNLIISEDNLKPGNHAFEHVPDGKNKNWAYTMIPTRFKSGVTYKVEFDIRVTKDHTGADVEKASLSWNLRYTDIVGGSYKPMADHHAVLGIFGTDDGWQHVSFTHKVSDTALIRDNDYFAIFANPIEADDGSFRVIGYMIDNIKVSVVN